MKKRFTMKSFLSSILAFGSLGATGFSSLLNTHVSAMNESSDLVDSIQRSGAVWRPVQIGGVTAEYKGLNAAGAATQKMTDQLEAEIKGKVCLEPYIRFMLGDEEKASLVEKVPETLKPVLGRMYAILNRSISADCLHVPTTAVREGEKEGGIPVVHLFGKHTDGYYNVNSDPAAIDVLKATYPKIIIKTLAIVDFCSRVTIDPTPSAVESCRESLLHVIPELGNLMETLPNASELLCRRYLCDLLLTKLPSILIKSGCLADDLVTKLESDINAFRNEWTPRVKALQTIISSSPERLMPKQSNKPRGGRPRNPNQNRPRT